MAVFVNARTKVLCQGTFHTGQAIAHGTKMVGGGSSCKGGTGNFGFRVLMSGSEARATTRVGLPAPTVAPQGCRRMKAGWALLRGPGCGVTAVSIPQDARTARNLQMQDPHPPMRRRFR